MQCEATCGSVKCVLSKDHNKAHQNDDGSIKWENDSTTDQGFKPMFSCAHTPREGIMNFYSTGEVPEDYECSQCGAKGCKLWRQYNTMASCLDLMCGPCALKDQNKEGADIDDQGYIRDPEIDGMKCDQIGWLVPAVPCEEEEATYWGYSLVPPDGVKWWRALPSKP